MAKITPIRVFYCFNITVFVIAIILVGLSLIVLSELDDSTIFNDRFYTTVIVFALFSFGLVYLGCIGGENPQERPNMLFCHWLIVLVILSVNCFYFYYFTLMTRGLNDEVDYENDPIIAAFRNSLAREFNDRILSTYVVCCTGCLQGIDSNLACNSDLDSFSVKCSESLVASQLGTDELGEDQCIYPQKCENIDYGDTSKYVGLGCFQTISEVPGFNIGSNVCSYLEYSGLVDIPAYGCGGGLPSAYVDDFVDYYNDRYFRIAVPWIIFICFLSGSFIASCILILCNTGGRHINGQ